MPNLSLLELLRLAIPVTSLHCALFYTARLWVGSLSPPLPSAWIRDPAGTNTAVAVAAALGWSPPSGVACSWPCCLLPFEGCCLPGCCIRPCSCFRGAWSCDCCCSWRCRCCCPCPEACRPCPPWAPLPPPSCATLPPPSRTGGRCWLLKLLVGTLSADFLSPAGLGVPLLGDLCPSCLCPCPCCPGPR